MFTFLGFPITRADVEDPARFRAWVQRNGLPIGVSRDAAFAVVLRNENLARERAAGITPSYDPATGRVNPDAAAQLAMSGRFGPNFGKATPMNGMNGGYTIEPLPPTVLYSSQPQNLGTVPTSVYVPSPTGMGMVQLEDTAAQRFSLGGAISGVLGGLVTGGPVGAIAGGILGGFGGGGGGNATSVPMGGMVAQNGGGFGMMLATPVSCPAGYTRVGSQCVRPGAALPGGAPFTVPASNGNGAAFGTPMVPMMVSQVVSRCGPKYVLGSDGMCYHKSILPKRFRKWVPPTKPLLTGGDRNILRKASSLKNRVKKAASSAGLTCRKSGAPRAAPKRKR